MRKMPPTNLVCVALRTGGDEFSDDLAGREFRCEVAQKIA